MESINSDVKDKENTDSVDKLTNQMRLKCVIDQKEKDRIATYLNSTIKMSTFTKLKETNTNLIKNDPISITNIRNNDKDSLKKVLPDDNLKQRAATVECKTVKKSSKIDEYLNSRQASKKKNAKITAIKTTTADSECSSVTSTSSSSQACTSSTSVTPISRSPSMHPSTTTKLIRDKSHTEELSNVSEKPKKIEPKRTDEWKVISTTHASNTIPAKKPSRLSEYLRKDNQKTTGSFSSTTTTTITDSFTLNTAKPQPSKQESSPSIKPQKSQYFCMCNDLASLSPLSSKITNIVNTAKSLNNSKVDDNQTKTSVRSLSLDKYGRAYEHFLPNAKLVDYFRKKSIEWNEMSKNLVDTHCHFDMLFTKIRYNKSTSQYFEDYKAIYLSNFEACVNVMCDPTKYSNRYKLEQSLTRFKHQKVFLTIGCHPHFADYWTPQVETIIRSCVHLTKIVAIGECGLDLSRKNNVDMKQQELVFEAQLKIANDTGLPLVIHCRDTEAIVYDILKKNVKLNHRIHLHCFTGGWPLAKKFLDTFVNLCIGVTPLITYNTSRTNDLVSNIPLERLLLETDSPYFVPDVPNFPSGIECSHPGFIYATAEHVASVKNVSLNQVLDMNRRNVHKIYNF